MLDLHFPYDYRKKIPARYVFLEPLKAESKKEKKIKRKKINENEKLREHIHNLYLVNARNLLQRLLPLSAAQVNENKFEKTPDLEEIRNIDIEWRVLLFNTALAAIEASSYICFLRNPYVNPHRRDGFKHLDTVPDEDFVFFVLPEQFKFSDPDFNERVQEHYLKNNPAIPRDRGDPTHLFWIPEPVWNINLPTLHDKCSRLDKAIIPNFFPGMPGSSFVLNYLKDNTVLTTPHYPDEIKMALVKRYGSPPSISESLTPLTPKAAIAHWREAARGFNAQVLSGNNRRNRSDRLGRYRRDTRAILHTARPR